MAKNKKQQKKVVVPMTAPSSKQITIDLYHPNWGKFTRSEQHALNLLEIDPSVQRYTGQDGNSNQANADDSTDQGTAEDTVKV